jgi:hypothetical protein
VTGELPDPASNRLEGTLAALTPSGDGYLARIDFGGLALDAHLTRAEVAARGLGPGA